MSHGADSLKSVLYALGANFGIALGKTVAAVVTNSGSMVAEAIHSYADCGNQALLLWGLRAAKQPPSADFPMGHGKAIYFWSFLVALLLFSVGGMFSVYEGWHKLQAPEPIAAPWIALAVLVFSVVLEAFSLAAAVREINHVRGRRSWLRWFRESRQSEMVVVFGEDVAALCGLVFALLAVLLTVLTGNALWDALGSILIGVLLIVVAIGVATEVKALLVGQSAEAPVREGIAALVSAHPAVAQLLELITLHFGDDVMVAVKARMKDAASTTELCERINDAEAQVKREFPQVKWVFFEPDVKH
jgi:cation diffusion facilitator family transporter